MNVKEECYHQHRVSCLPSWNMGDAPLELCFPHLYASSSLQWFSPLSPASSVSPSLVGHFLEYKIDLNTHVFFFWKSLPWPYVPIQLLPRPSALYSKTLKNWLILAFHSLSNHSTHLSSPPCPWNNSYQGLSATPNPMVTSLSSSNRIVTQLSTLIFPHHFLLLASMTPHS